MKPIVIAVALSVLVSGPLLAQQNHVPAKWIDPSIESCVQFDRMQEHYEAAFQVVVDHYETVPYQKEPVGVLKGIENPQKLSEFMAWYASGGGRDLSIAGEACRGEMLIKDGSSAERIAALVFSTENMEAQFFIDHILKRYDSLVQDYNSLVKASQKYVQASQAYIVSLERNARQTQARPVFVFPRPQSLTCTGDILAFSDSISYLNQTQTTTNATTTIRCQ